MGENLARREGFKDFIVNQGCRHPASRLAQLRRVPRDQAHRRSRAHLRLADGESQHGQPGEHVRDVPVGRIDPRLHVVRDSDRRRRLDGSGAGARRAVHQGRVHSGQRQTGARHHAESGRGESALSRPARRGGDRSAIGECVNRSSSGPSSLSGAVAPTIDDDAPIDDLRPFCRPTAIR